METIGGYGVEAWCACVACCCRRMKRKKERVKKECRWDVPVSELMLVDNRVDKGDKTGTRQQVELY